MAGYDYTGAERQARYRARKKLLAAGLLPRQKDIGDLIVRASDAGAYMPRDLRELAAELGLDLKLDKNPYSMSQRVFSMRLAEAADALAQRAIEKALDGDGGMLSLLIGKGLPAARQERGLAAPLAGIDLGSVDGVAAAQARVAALVAAGGLDVGDALQLNNMLSNVAETLERHSKEKLRDEMRRALNGTSAALLETEVAKLIDVTPTDMTAADDGELDEVMA